MGPGQKIHQTSTLYQGQTKIPISLQSVNRVANAIHIGSILQQYQQRCLANHLRHKVVPRLHHVEQQGHELELRTHHVDIRNFFYEPFRGQGELLIIETFRPEVLTLGILTVGQAYQEECEIYKASIVLGKLGKGYIIRGILLGGDIRNSRLGMY